MLRTAAKQGLLRGGIASALRFHSYKAAVFGDKGRMDIVEKQSRPLKQGEARLKMECCGVCHTDLHIREGEFGDVKGTVGGHEGIGIVEEVAPDVTSLAPGDRASVAWLASACGHCEYCLSGNENVCPDIKMSGYTTDGGMAEECYVKANYAVKVPDGLDSGLASSISCAGVTSYKAIKVSNIKPGQWLAIYGMGGLGNLALQYAKNAFGAKVIAVDVLQKQLDFAKSCGADVVINSKEEDAVAKIKEVTDGLGANAAVVPATSLIAFENAVNCVRPLGRAVLVGVIQDKLPLNIPYVVLNGIEVVGSVVGTRLDLAEAFELARSGVVRPKVAPRKLEEVNTIMDELRDGKVTGRMAIYF